MSETASIAIETSCRYGGVALGVGERLIDRIDFDASSRHATHLVVRLRSCSCGTICRRRGWGSFMSRRGRGALPVFAWE